MTLLQSLDRANSLGGMGGRQSRRRLSLSGPLGRSAVVCALEPRVLLVGLVVAVDMPQTFQFGGTYTPTFSGAQKGVVTSIGNGNCLYTPNPGAIGVDGFTATYQPTYGGGGYGGYTPPPVSVHYEVTIAFPFGASNDDSYANPDTATNTAYPTINYFVLKDNVLSIPVSKGVLKNDTLAKIRPIPIRSPSRKRRLRHVRHRHQRSLHVYALFLRLPKSQLHGIDGHLPIRRKRYRRTYKPAGDREGGSGENRHKTGSVHRFRDMGIKKSRLCQPRCPIDFVKQSLGW